MKWQKHSRFKYGKESYYLKDYPFFHTEIARNRDNEYGINYYIADRINKKKTIKYANFSLELDDTRFETYKTVKESKEAVIKKFYNYFKSLDMKKFKLDKSGYIAFNETDWCNNNGYGKYTNKNLWEKYRWIEGVFLNTSSVSNNYSIRYERDKFSKSEAKHHGLMVVKRHINRFIREVENDYKHLI